MELHLQLKNLTTPLPLTDYLKDELLLPRKVRHFLRTRKQVLRNGKPLSFHEEVKNGDHLTLIFLASDYPVPTILLGKKAELTIVYEDEHLLVVDKPQGQKTHPNDPTENNTLLNHVAAYLKDQEKSPYIVHRLDKETSGLVLLAKDPVVLPILGRMLEKREIHREYEAIATGKISEKHFTIDQPIGRDRHDRRKRRIDSLHGQPAMTHVTVVNATAKTTAIKCLLATGRTHQIRVHLASIGHPLVGDPLYNPQTKKDEKLALRGVALTFTHPFTQEKLNLTATKHLF